MSEGAVSHDLPAIHLVVGTPCFGGNVTHHYAISALNLQLACLQRRIGLSFKLLGNDSLVTRARNIIVGQFLDEPGATHLLFIDADLGFSPDQVFALLDAGKEVAGAVYPMKRLDWPRIAAKAQAGAADLKSAALDYVVDLIEPERIAPEDRFARARYIGTGFLMIRREVFGRMAERYPDLAYNGMNLRTNPELASANAFAFFDCMIDPETGTYLSEDYAFCKLWREMGGEIWADLASRLTHVGPVPFEGDIHAVLREFVKPPPG